MSNVSSLIQKSVRDSHASAARLRKECALDVVMVIDTSGSICDNKQEDCKNWRDQRDAAVHFAEQLAQKQASKVGVLTFSTNAQWRAKLTTDIASVASEIRGLDYVTLDAAWPRWTNLKEALNRAQDELIANPNPDHRQLVMVFTDGEPTAGGAGKVGVDLASHVSAARMAADNLRANFQLSMVAIGKADTNYMQSLVTQPVGENFFPVTTFQSLTKGFIDDILQEICKTPQPTPVPVVPPPPTPQPTPQPPPPPTPSPPHCEKDTRAECESIKDLCFQWTRGHTECRTSFDGRKTCHCVEEDECVRNTTKPLTRGGKWGICRRWVGGKEDPSDVRGEGNPVSWFFTISMDIFATYFKMLR
jgi:uncharacterized protein YegL